MNTINRDTVMNIIDIFEDFLDDKGVKIKNTERDEQEPGNDTNLWGDDFDFLSNKISETLSASGVHIAQVFDDYRNPANSLEDPLIIYVPLHDDVIRIEEGTGDNLSREDIADGFVDYVNYYVDDAENICDDSSCSGPRDGGMVMYESLIREKLSSLKEVVPDVLRDIYDNEGLTWIELSGGKPWRE